MPPAVIGGAIAAAGAIGGSVLAGGATKSAANTAAASAERTAESNNALARDIYSQNKSVLSPYVTRGNAAGGAINALLGIGSGDAAGGDAGMTDWDAYLDANPDILAGYYSTADKQHFATPQDYAQWHYGTYGQVEGRALPTANDNGGASGVTAAQDAFANYRDSSGYQFRYNQGMNALNTGYAARGLINSGAAQKAALKFGQDYGSNEFGNYLGYLSNQQGVGLSGASALAGVGQNYVGTVSANNNSAGSAAANAALISGTANANTYNGIASALGKLASSFDRKAA